jgi:predicted site-specific integrase-resolvase
MCEGRRMTDTDAPQLDLIGSSEAAAIAGVHVATIARWAADGTLPIAARLAGKTNPLLFHRADVERVVADKAKAASA